MSADRLREAADALYDRPPFLAVHQDRATAALLRAVAGYIDHNPDGPGWSFIDAALALADTILGDTDE